MPKIPVLFLIFNREDAAVAGFRAIREYRPERLYIAADGPRASKPGEAERCEATRRAVLSLIDWPCDVHTLLRDTNLGCADAVSGAISWFFASEPFGAIIEDDVVVSQSFFHMCEQLLPEYAADDRVMMITSQFFGSEADMHPDRYSFSNYGYIWGWASWRRAWERMDMTMGAWPRYSFYRLVRAYGFFRALMHQFYYSRGYKLISTGQTFNSWATRWCFSILANNGLVIVPEVNLSRNIGCTGVGGAHYEADDKDPYDHLTIGNISSPMHTDDPVAVSSRIKRLESRDFRRIRMIGARKKLRKLLHPNKR